MAGRGPIRRPRTPSQPSSSSVSSPVFGSSTERRIADMEAKFNAANAARAAQMPSPNENAVLHDAAMAEEGRRLFLPAPGVHSSANPDEWLLRKFETAVQDGVPRGSQGRMEVPGYLHDVIHDREYVWNLQKMLEELGITELDPFGQNDLPRQGAYKTAFSAGDNVVKFGQPGQAEWEESALPQGVWGVTPLTKAFEYSPAMSENNPHFMHDGLSVFLQPRTELNHPKWGSPWDNAVHHRVLRRALEKQGWGWNDDHLNNMAFLPGEDYRPTVIDGSVQSIAGDKTYEIPFRPPTKPDWYYNWLLPLLTGAAATSAASQQTQGPLAGLTEQ